MTDREDGLMNVQVGYGFSYSTWASVSARSAAASGQAPAQPVAPAAQPGQPKPVAPAAAASAPADSAPVARPSLRPGGAWFTQLPQTASVMGGFGMFAQLGFPLLTAAPAAGQSAGGEGSPSASDAGGATGVPAEPRTTPPAAAPAGDPVAQQQESGSAAVAAPAGSWRSAPSAPAREDSEQTPRATVERVDSDTFDRYRLKQRSVTHTTSLKLELETREGDRIVLDFSQLDVRDRTRFQGVDAEGDRVRLRESGETTARLVNLEVTGELSDEERAAIDEVLAQLVDMAGSYFGGSMETAVARLEEMDFDAGTLLDVSFQMSVSRRVEMTRGYVNAEDGLTRLASRDSEVKKTLEFFADGQRRILEAAREAMHQTSAVKMVRQLLPAMLQSTGELADVPRGERIHDGGRHRCTEAKA